MRFFKILLIMMVVSVLAVSCTMKKEMSLEDYATIEMVLNLPNWELVKSKV